MFGSSVVVEPKAIGYHLASPRGYTYNHDDYLHNVLNIGMALDMMDWTERAWINWLRRGRTELLEKMWKEAEEETAEDRKFIQKKRVMTFNEMLKELPWDKMNDKKHGKHLSGLQIFHDSWLPLIKDTPAEKYYPGKYQVGLEKFINSYLSEFVYKRKR